MADSGADVPGSQAELPAGRRGARLAACLFAAAGIAVTSAASARDPNPGEFDYYALALSWSPTYCGLEAGQADRQQCGSGLRMHGYFRLTRDLFGKLRIPARYLSPQAVIMTTPQELVSDFVKTNRDFTSDMPSVQCGNSRGAALLAELGVCFGKDGRLQSCGANEKRQCQAKSLVLPPVRGGNR